MDVVWRMERPPSVGKALRKIGFYHTEKEKGHRGTLAQSKCQRQRKSIACAQVYTYSVLRAKL
jgi:hypothetical protein